MKCVSLFYWTNLGYRHNKYGICACDFTFPRLILYFVQNLLECLSHGERVLLRK